MSTFYMFREQQILEWGNERNITGKNAQSTKLGQLKKTKQELEEWCSAHTKDDIGDIYVTLVLGASYWGYSIGDIVAPIQIQRQQLGGISLVEVDEMIEKEGIDSTLKQCIINIEQDINDNDESAFSIDVYVSIYVLMKAAASIDTDFDSCVQLAWDDIKHRTGKMVHGLFVKQKDLDLLDSVDVKYTELYGSPCFLVTNVFSKAAFETLNSLGFVVKENKTIGLQK